MPLEPRSSRATIDHNIAVEIKAGKPRTPAAVIASGEAGEDEAAPGEHRRQTMKFYTPQKLSNNQAFTNEGFLLCRDVAIARTGELIYGPDETPIKVGRDGLVRVQRNPEEVFRPETLASFEGKPVTNEHPDEGVEPENFKKYVVGVVQNVRRGQGIYDDCVVADLLIQDKEAIEAVRDGKREVSCGYDAEYEQTEPGRGRQTDIVGNHVALVEQGRCGPRCAIQDRSSEMTKKATVLDRIKAAFTLKDEKAFMDAVKDAEAQAGAGEGEANGVQVHVHNYGEKDKEEVDPAKANEGKEAKEGDAGEGSEVTMEQRMAKLEELVKKLCDGGTADESEEEEEEEEGGKEKTGDAAAHKALVQDLVSRAELLAPGFKVPTFDVKSTDPKKIADMLCKCRRKALDAAYATDDGKAAIEPFLAGQKAEFAKMPDHTVDAVFIGASELIRQKNNAGGTRDKLTVRDFGKAVTPETINKRNAEFWAARKSA